jgi:NTE family protein
MSLGMNLKRWFSFGMVLFLLAGCLESPYAVHPLKDEDASLRPLSERPRLALVLGGGGSRGLAHVGVLEVLEQAHVPVDLIVATSAGGIVGALYANYPNAQHVKTQLLHLKRPDFVQVNLWRARFGLADGKSLVKFLEHRLKDKQFHQLQIPLVVVATDLNSGERVCFQEGDVVPAVHASCAFPIIFQPVEHQGRVLVDGGVVAPVPVEVARELGAEVVIAVNVSQSLPNHLPTNLFGVAKRSIEITYFKQSQASLRHADVVISPELGDMGIFDDDANTLSYEAGKKAAENALPAIIDITSAEASVDQHEGAH